MVLVVFRQTLFSVVWNEVLLGGMILETRPMLRSSVYIQVDLDASITYIRSADEKIVFI